VDAVVRDATVDDVDELAEVHVRCWHEAYGHLLSPKFFEQRTPQRVAEWWKQRFARLPADEVVRVAVVDGAIVGFAGSGPCTDDPPPRPLQLYMINLLQAHHGSGIGQALLDATVADAPASLWMAKENPRALAFYRRNGFAPDGAEQSDPAWENLEEIRLVR
jgi:GNAT superfamily N-acetyltransferase